ncbi:MAG: hypothetical protein EP329_05150 [Deltaproteobacteria bacterium]|nr:MAG: hypothetical protein EP329_05150 [Deltaproteobacteria bacterium]
MFIRDGAAPILVTTLLAATLLALPACDTESACDQLRSTGNSCNTSTLNQCKSSEYPCGFFVDCGDRCSDVGAIGCDPATATCTSASDRQAMLDAIVSDNQVACQSYVDQLCR